MRNQSVQQPDWWMAPGPKTDHRRLTTIDAARVLHLTAEGVRSLVRNGKLAAERTLRGQYLFRPDEVLALADARSRTALTLVRPRMRKARHGPRQLDLFAVQRRQGEPDFRPDIYGLRSPTETAADRSGKRDVTS